MYHPSALGTLLTPFQAMQFLRAQRGHPLISTICIRTLCDNRYFHGVRTLAADVLTRSASADWDWIGLFHLQKAFQEMFCFPGSPMTRSNDFSDRATYLLQCAIPRAMAKVRDSKGKSPASVKTFFLDKLKFNDNSNNEYSDCYYVSVLLSCLAESLIPQGRRETHDLFEDDAALEESMAEAEFLKKAVEEVDRYRRIDEWLPSYQNIHTVTAMDCMQGLMSARMIPQKAADFLQYTRPGNADPIRLKAFQCLARLNLFGNPAILGYVLQSFAFESSPYLRAQIWNSLWLGLGHLALTKARAPVAAPVQNGGLILEQEQPAVSQPVARGIAGVVQALQNQLGDNESLGRFMSEALRSPALGPTEFMDVLQICEMLFKEIDQVVLTLKYPRYWQAVHLGGGQLRFSQTGRVRTKQMPESALTAKTKKRTTTSNTARVERSNSPNESLKRRRESTNTDIAGQPQPTKLKLFNRKSSITSLAPPSAPSSAPPQPVSAPPPPPPPFVQQAPHTQPSPRPEQPIRVQQAAVQRSQSPAQRQGSSKSQKKSLIIKLPIPKNKLLAIAPGASARAPPSPARTSTSVPPGPEIKSEVSSPDVAMADMSEPPPQALQPRAAPAQLVSAPAPAPAPTPPAPKAPGLKLKLNFKPKNT